MEAVVRKELYLRCAFVGILANRNPGRRREGRVIFNGFLENREFCIETEIRIKAEFISWSVLLDRKVEMPKLQTRKLHDGQAAWEPGIQGYRMDPFMERQLAGAPYRFSGVIQY